MNDATFFDIIDRQYKSCLRTLESPAKKRTAGDDDRLIQFKKVAAHRRITPEQALGGMMSKHTSDLYDLIDGTHLKIDDVRVWKEIITDHINYLYLLRGLVEERFGKKEE
uniref:Uncharacterized protein n=1 Tax=viral metagenome TaxID=1070528 RepID=A0A6M3LRN4_9ZZZZ